MQPGQSLGLAVAMSDSVVAPVRAVADGCRQPARGALGLRVGPNVAAHGEEVRGPSMT